MLMQPEVSVQIKPNENGIIIEISDNGKGFDLDTTDLGKRNCKHAKTNQEETRAFSKSNRNY